MNPQAMQLQMQQMQMQHQMQMQQMQMQMQMQQMAAGGAAPRPGLAMPGGPGATGMGMPTQVGYGAGMLNPVSPKAVIPDESQAASQKGVSDSFNFVQDAMKNS